MENEEFKKEFRVLNLSIEKLSLYYGIFLIIWGILKYTNIPKKMKKEIVTQKVASIVINIYLYFF